MKTSFAVSILKKKKSNIYLPADNSFMHQLICELHDPLFRLSSIDLQGIYEYNIIPEIIPWFRSILIAVPQSFIHIKDLFLYFISIRLNIKMLYLKEYHSIVEFEIRSSLEI